MLELAVGKFEEAVPRSSLDGNRPARKSPGCMDLAKSYALQVRRCQGSQRAIQLGSSRVHTGHYERTYDLSNLYSRSPISPERRSLRENGPDHTRLNRRSSARDEVFVAGERIKDLISFPHCDLGEQQ